MRRRTMRASWLLGCLLTGFVTFGASPVRSDENPREMLHRYLIEQARQQFDTRRKAIGAIKTPDDISKRQKEMRSFLLRSLGEFPERTPLNARVVGTLRREGYRVDKVIFESRPDHHVTANLYLPDGQLPFPGVL